MKKTANRKSALISSAFIFIGTTGSYISMYDKITCKPTQAGFWYILIMGLSMGILITLLVFWLDERKREKKEIKE